MVMSEWAGKPGLWGPDEVEGKQVGNTAGEGPGNGRESRKPWAEDRQAGQWASSVRGGRSLEETGPGGGARGVQRGRWALLRAGSHQGDGTIRTLSRRVPGPQGKRARPGRWRDQSGGGPSLGPVSERWPGKVRGALGAEAQEGGGGGASGAGLGMGPGRWEQGVGVGLECG